MRSDRRLKGHPTMTQKWQQEGRPRPTEALPAARAIPLHYQVPHQDSRVLLDESGAPRLHHEALEYITAARPERAAAGRGWLSTAQVARLLELDPSSVRDAIKDGQIPAEQPTGEGGSYRIPCDQFEGYLHARGYSPERVRDLRTTWLAWLDQVEH